MYSLYMHGSVRSCNPAPGPPNPSQSEARYIRCVSVEPIGVYAVANEYISNAFCYQSPLSLQTLTFGKCGTIAIQSPSQYNLEVAVL